MLTLRQLQNDEQAVDFLKTHGVRAGERYLEMRLKGESHNMAEMLATRSFPGFTSDDTFMRGWKTGEQFAGNPGLGAYYRAVAEDAGVSTQGKAYISGIAEFPGDPRAWVGGKSDVLRVARERNLNVDGTGISHVGHEVEPEPSIPVAPDILADSAMRIHNETGMKWTECVDKAYSLRTGGSDIGQPWLVDDSTPHPEEVVSRDGDL